MEINIENYDSDPRPSSRSKNNTKQNYYWKELDWRVNSDVISEYALFIIIQKFKRICNSNIRWKIKEFR